MTGKQKKKLEKAAQTAIQAELTRRRYLIRNPDFLKDLRRVQQAWKGVPKPPADVPEGWLPPSDYLSRYGPGTPYRHYRDTHKAAYDEIAWMLQKWQFPLTESAIRKMPPVDGHRFTKYMDAWLSRYFRRMGLEQISPVQMWPESNIHDLDVNEPYVDFHLRLDRTHPVSELLPLIGGTLNFLLSDIVHQPLTRSRRRLEKVDFNLKVFDLASQQQTFSHIARQLHSRPSTVKSAYLVAGRNIFGKPLRKKEAPIAAFDPQRHTQKCPTCQKAQTVKELCPKARSYANYAYKSQRELTGHNTTAYTTPKQKTGNRRVPKAPGAE